MTSTAIASELRSRIPSRLNGRIWKPFATYEAFYDRGNGGWNQKSSHGRRYGAAPEARVISALVHLGHSDRGLRDVNYLQFGLIVSTK